MTAAEMDIVIGANVDEAIAGLNKLGYSITKVEGESEQLGEQFQLSTRHALGFSQGMTELAATAGEGGLNMRGFFEVLRTGAMEFSHIQAETGSTATAFKSLAGAIFSEETVILLAITAVSTLAGHLLNAKDATKEHTKATQEYSEAIKQTGQQLVKVTELISTYNLANTSLDQRKKIIEDLQGINANYFGQLNTEKTNVNDLSTAYNNYLNSLVAIARAKGAQSEIEGLSNKLITVQQNVADIEKPFTNLNLTFKQASELLKGVAPGANAFDTMQKAFDRIDQILKGQYVPSFEDIALLSKVTGQSEQQINETLSKRQYLQTQQLQLLAQIKTLSDQIAKNDPLGIKTDTKSVKEGIDITPRIKIFRGDNLDIVYQQVQDAMIPVQRKLDKGPGLTVPVHVDVSPETAKQITDEVNILMSGVVDTIVAVGEGIGNALSGKGGFFSGILQAIGQSLQALGKYVITASELISKIETALMAAFHGNAILGVGVGIALIALGGVLKNVPKFATGGIVTRPTLALVGEAGPEKITPLGYEGSAANAMAGEVVFTISGNVMRGTLKRANNIAANIYGN